ncbi:YcaO domain-containing protein [Rubrivivax sp. A210]|nr:YcaO domain-containing protein [Rubrivivax sp. A210]
MGWRTRAGLCLMRRRRGGPCIACLGQRLREAGFAPQGPIEPAPNAELQALLAAQDPGPGWLAPVLRLDGGQAFVHALLAVPGCPSCSAAPKSPTKGAPAVPLAALRDPLLGLVSDLQRRTPGVDADALCHGLSGRVHMPRLQDQIGVRGHGFTPEAAAQGLLGEAVERYSALRPDLSRIRLARRGELAPGESLGAELFGLSEAQREAAGLTRLDGRQRIGWVRGERLRDGAKVWVPAAAAYLSREWRPDEPRYAPQNSHGTAAHLSAAQATERALLELWERRTMTRAWHLQDFGQALGAAHLGAAARELGQRLDAAGVQWQVSLLGRAPQAAVALALLWHDEAPWFLVGSAARLHIEAAADAALLEAASGWQGLVRNPEPLRKQPRLRMLDDAASHHRWHAGPQRGRALVDAIRRATRPTGPLPTEAGAAPLQALMAEAAPSAVVVAIQSPDIAAAGFHVHRVLAPGWPLFNFGRIGTPEADRQAAGWPPAPGPHPYR